MVPAALRPHGLLFVMLALLSGAALAPGCAPRPRAPECPSGRWCGSLAQVDALGQTRERVLTCPMYVGWAEDAGAAPASELPARGEGKIDLEATRARRVAGEADACCYHWFASCPAGKTAVDGGSGTPAR